MAQLPAAFSGPDSPTILMTTFGIKTNLHKDWTTFDYSFVRTNNFLTNIIWEATHVPRIQSQVTLVLVICKIPITGGHGTLGTYCRTFQMGTMGSWERRTFELGPREHRTLYHVPIGNHIKLGS